MSVGRVEQYLRETIGRVMMLVKMESDFVFCVRCSTKCFLYKYAEKDIIIIPIFFLRVTLKVKNNNLPKISSRNDGTSVQKY